MNFKPNPAWQIRIDTGGTFTDCIARDPSGQFHQVKVLSSSALRGFIKKQIDHKRFQIAEKWSAPDDFVAGFRFQILDREHPRVSVKKYNSKSHQIELSQQLDFDVSPGTAFEVCSPEEAPILAARMVTKTLPTNPLPAISMRLATTRGTNALLERKGVPPVLFITRGFGDLLLIGNQQRPDIFALEIVKPEPLYAEVVEVEERLTADGSVLAPLNTEILKQRIAQLSPDSSAAVALMHSYRNPIHEKEIVDLLAKRGFRHISCSSDLAPFIKIVPRAETTVVNAYLAPVIEDYLKKINSKLTDGRLHVMTSAGGLVRSEDYHAKDSLLSGPAGGVVGAALAGTSSGFKNIIAFDMGGTSTDVARFDGDYEYVFEHQVGDAHLVSPALAIESVAAGGGSICSYDGFRLKVGPESAGARPGPACYGAGGPLTLTDVNLLLGRLNPHRFEIPISRKSAAAVLAAMQKKISTKNKVESEVLLQGLLDIANERMADAIRRVSIRKGYDPQDYALLAFGGAGGQHACGIAERLGIRTIVVPKDASLLSAFGLGHASFERFAEKQILKPISEIESNVSEIIDALADEARRAITSEGIAGEDIIVRRTIINMRFVGQDSTLAVEYKKGMSLHEAFINYYREIFGHLPEGREIEIESARVVCSTAPAAISQSGAPSDSFPATPEGEIQACFSGSWQPVSFYERRNLSQGAQIPGPALILEQHSTTVIEEQWQAEIDGADAIIITKTPT